MSLLKRLDEDLKTALKKSDKLKLSVMRMAKAAAKNQQIDKGRDLQDEEILAIFSTLAKQGGSLSNSFRRAAGMIWSSRRPGNWRYFSPICRPSCRLRRLMI